MSIKRVFEYFPKLGPHLKKGECGRIAVVGGALEYTGAPYFSAMAPMKIGADLSYLFCPIEAAAVIKTYSPELIVHPSQEFEKIDGMIGRIDSLVIGPGLGRDKEKLVPLLRKILNRVRNQGTLSVVIDADGLFLLADCIDEVKACPNVILTPNHREFDRLYEIVFGGQKPQGDITKQVQKLAKELRVIIFRKGEEDIITDGEKTEIGKEQGCDRRCGGQGDLLSGTIALFSYWVRLKEGTSSIKSEHLILGGHLASDFIRFCSRYTFSNIGRSMNATDILDNIRHVVKEHDV
uniref:ATP-dependent (S)-NAD(P)H-hydrate dehydratase n=1 Tax=Bursaphelenchus xylophilus TaxID=6326 RepID=A0A1I7RRM6_BURXY